MKHMARSALALITAVGLAFTVVPAAQASTPYVAATSCTLFGEGTAEQPYQVASVSDLLQLSVNACVPDSTRTLHFSQQTNIYLDDTRAYPSGVNPTEASVVYDGNGFGIFGLHANAISSAPEMGASLFGWFGKSTATQTFEVRDLLVVASDILATHSIDNFQGVAIGALFSATVNVDVTLENVNVFANRIALTSNVLAAGPKYAGGIIGWQKGGSLLIRNSSVRAVEISAVGTRGTGGLIGAVEEQSGAEPATVLIEDSRVQAAIGSNSSPSSRAALGGIVGSLEDTLATVRRVVVEGSVAGGTETYGIGGAVGLVLANQSSSAINLTDTVVAANVAGGSVAGFVGEVDSGSRPKVAAGITNSIFSGQLSINEEAISGSSSAVMGRTGADFDLNLNGVVLDATFKETGSGTVGGKLLAAEPPNSRSVNNTYFNSTKFAASEWDSNDDHGGEGYWGAAPLTQGEFGLQSSFAGLTFGAANGAAAAGVFEMCAGVTRPHHSIEASACNAPALSLPGAVNLVVGQRPEVAVSNDPSQFKFFTVTPALPEGLELNPFSGELIGHALSAAAAQTYTVTALSNGGNVQQTFTLGVAAGSAQLNLNAGDGSGESDSVTVASGLIETPASPFSDSGRFFMGWNLDSSTGEFFAAGSQIPVGGDLTLVANWLYHPDCSGDGATFGDMNVLCGNVNSPFRDTDGRYGGPIASGGELFFPVDHEFWGTELWSTDGTPGGTSMLADVNPRELDSVESLIGKLGNKLLYFDSDNEALMAYDLETQGRTVLTPNGTLSSYGGEYQAAVLGDQLIFNGYQAATGYELWVSDGTPGGTSILEDINPGAGDSYPIGLLEHEGYVYFSAADDGSNYELWRTDGTADGTQLFLDLAPGASSDPYPHAVVGGNLLVAAFGTPAGIYAVDLEDKTAVRLTTTRPGYYSGVLGDGSGLIFGSAASGTTVNEIWFTDGTVDGTRRIAQIEPALYTFFDGFFSAGGDVFFTADDGTGVSVYRTDGTADGTGKTFTNLTRPDLVGAVNGRLIVFAALPDGGERLFVYSDPDYVAPPTVTQNPLNPGTQPPAGASGGAPATPQVTSAPVAVSAPGQSFELRGANLRGVLVTIDGKSAFSKINDAGNLEVIVPNLSPGTYDIVLTLGSATITMSSHLILGSTASAALGEPRGWTKRISETEIKLYFKNPVGAGKVQLYHNGQEIAWVNARTNADPKLREAGGSQYLVRTRRLEPGFNTFEIYVDGERVVRRVQSN
jgi:ELWxxDGT repeat protein